MIQICYLSSLLNSSENYHGLSRSKVAQGQAEVNYHNNNYLGLLLTPWGFHIVHVIVSTID